MWYIITGVVSFCLGFFIAARTKSNITIGFGNQTVTTINGEVVEEK